METCKEMQPLRKAGSAFLPARHTSSSAEHQHRDTGAKLPTPWRKRSPLCALKRIRRSAGSCPKGAVQHQGQGIRRNQERIKRVGGI